jgi:hypothetical protein
MLLVSGRRLLRARSRRGRHVRNEDGRDRRAEEDDGESMTHCLLHYLALTIDRSWNKYARSVHKGSHAPEIGIV